jgi:predicted HTH domain antitoxin
LALRGLAIHLFEQDKFSLGKARQLAGMTIPTPLLI